MYASSSAPRLHMDSSINSLNGAIEGIIGTTIRVIKGNIRILGIRL